MRRAVPRGAARVALHDGVPGRHVGLGLVEQRPAVLGERAAVDRQQHRVRARPRRRGHPAVHRVAVRRRRRPLAHPVHAGRSPPAGGRTSVSSRRRPGVSAISSPADRSWATAATTTPPAAATPRTVNGPSTSVSGGTAVERHAQQLHRSPPLHADEHRAVDDDRRRRVVAAVVLLGVEQRPQRPPAASTRQGTGCRATKSRPVRPEVGDGGDDEPPVRRRRPAARSRRATSVTRRSPAPSGADGVDVVDQVAVGRSWRAETKASAAPSGRQVTSVQSASPVGDLDRLRRRDGVVRDVDRAGRRRRPGCGRSVRKPTSSRRYCRVRDQPRRLGRRADALDGAVPALPRGPAPCRPAAGSPATTPARRRRGGGRSAGAAAPPAVGSTCTCGLPPGSALR